MRNQLHIPMGRHSQTTRRSRRVVWHIGLAVLFGLAIIGQIMTLWFTRNRVFVAAPEETTTAIQFFVTDTTVPFLTKALSTSPLITNRDLTIEDLLPITTGQIGWFFHRDGSRSVAITSHQSLIPSELFDKKHIVVQQITDKVFLLSERMQPVVKIQANRPFSSLLPSRWTRLGGYTETNSTKLFPILGHEQEIRVQLPLTQKTHPLSRIPPDTYVALSTPVLTNIDSLSGLFQNFTLLADPFFQTSISTLFNKLLSAPGGIFLNNPKNTSFLLTSQATLSTNERVDLIRTILALKHPQRHAFQLQDSSTIQELTADPSSISVATRVIEGKEFHHATTGDQTLFISKEADILLSDREETIRAWLTSPENSLNTSVCQSNAGFIAPADLFTTNSSPYTSYSQNLLMDLSHRFQRIGLNQSKQTTELRLCF